MVDVSRLVGVNGDADADVLADDAVADVAPVGGGAYGRSRDRVFDRGVAQGVIVRCPTIGVLLSSINGVGMKRCGTIFAELVVVGGSGGGHIGTTHEYGYFDCLGTAAFVVGNSQSVGLILNQSCGLCGWTIGVCDHVFRLPMIGEGAFCSRIGGEDRRAGIVN